MGSGVFAEPGRAVTVKTAAVAAAGGEQSAVAACQSHEKALGGGYAITGTGFATSSLFVGDAWPAAAYDPDAAPATRYDSHARRPRRPGGHRPRAARAGRARRRRAVRRPGSSRRPRR
ncbi:hypothetical protein OG311_05030 [Streptomyces sp. NBC_01343]|uniref:hypothetical protein n=1 Tax=Streptomyces sp. NBC_01343 TaxID=2903832 RepID=UPI002E1413CC|nr:hypothetical protein OG311_05030 [Streptomyces sp. NBC_01343]